MTSGPRTTKTLALGGALGLAVLLGGCGPSPVEPTTPSISAGTPAASTDPGAPAPSTPPPSSPSDSPSEPADPESTASETTALESAIPEEPPAPADALAALDTERASIGVQTLDRAPGLDALAAAQAASYAADPAGWNPDLGAELAAAGFGTGALRLITAPTAPDALTSWLADADSRAALLDGTFGSVGLGDAAFTGGQRVFVVVLGYRADDGQLPAASAGAQEVLDLTNAERALAGLAPLALDERLNAAAQMQADHQAATLTMTHDGNGGLGARFDAAGYPYRSAAENVAVGQQTLAEVVQGWIDSPPHHANIVNPDLTEMGFSVAFGTDGRAYFAQTFGTR